MGFCRSKQSGKLGLSFLCVCTFRKDEGLDEAVKMQLWACHCAACQAHDPLAPLLRSNSGKGSLVVDFSPAGVSYPDDEFLRHARVTWKPDVSIFQAVRVGLAYTSLRGKVDVVWAGSAAWWCPTAPGGIISAKERGRCWLCPSLQPSTSAPTPHTHRPSPGCSWWSWTWWIRLKLKALFNACCQSSYSDTLAGFACLIIH